MSKHHLQQKKAHLSNRLGTSISIDPETINQVQKHTESCPSEFEGHVLAYEEIQRRAYQIHEEKGGSDFENWLEAERVLKEEHNTRR